LDRHEETVRAELQLVTEWLVSASAELAPAYFHLPVAGAEEAAFRERVYCYELYHLWRCHWPNDFRFALNGEVDKQKHPLISGAWKPDFLVHVPGEMVNLLVVEVKAGTADVKNMAEDLQKLTSFRRDLRDEGGRPANYHAAYFLVYGLDLRDWPTLRARLTEIAGGPKNFERNLVDCFVHPRAGTRAVRAAWE
jgi:hypothetical protein